MFTVKTIVLWFLNAAYVSLMLGLFLLSLSNCITSSRAADFEAGDREDSIPGRVQGDNVLGKFYRARVSGGGGRDREGRVGAPWEEEQRRGQCYGDARLRQDHHWITCYNGQVVISWCPIDYCVMVSINHPP